MKRLTSAGFVMASALAFTIGAFAADRGSATLLTMQFLITIGGSEVAGTNLVPGGTYQVVATGTESQLTVTILGAEGTPLYPQLGGRTENCDDDDGKATFGDAIVQLDPLSAEPHAQVTAKPSTLNPCLVLIDVPLTIPPMSDSPNRGDPHRPN